MVDFAGWAMPVQYTSIVAEHTATRTAAGLFDISHMGRFGFDGPKSAAFLDSLVTRRVVDLPIGKIRYALLTNESGGILDDVLVYHLQDGDSDPFHMMVVNAGNREKIASWLEARLPSEGVSFTDATDATVMIAVQGPQAITIASELFDADLDAIGYYSGVVIPWRGASIVVSRTGYTGEDGVEVIVPTKFAAPAWEGLMNCSDDRGIEAVGLGARDTLRLEAAMPLYGHEMDESIDPYQADLGFAVNLKDREFIGRDALVQRKQARAADDASLIRIGLQVSGRRAPRENYAVLHDNQEVGRITSGTFSPTLQSCVAMAYLPQSLAAVGQELQVDIRGTSVTATIVPLPFYRRGTN